MFTQTNNYLFEKLKQMFTNNSTLEHKKTDIKELAKINKINYYVISGGYDDLKSLRNTFKTKTILEYIGRQEIKFTRTKKQNEQELRYTRAEKKDDDDNKPVADRTRSKTNSNNINDTPVRLRPNPKERIHANYTTGYNNVLTTESAKKQDEMWGDIQTQLEDSDIDYIPEEKEYAKQIELWLCRNMKCPVCEQPTLKCYSSNNMPVIDLVCINHLHTKGVKYWQVKSTLYNSIFFLDGYFTKYTKIPETEYPHIYVGSRNKGNNIHIIKPSETLNHDMLIGYILIVFSVINDNTEIKFDMNNSYCVYPKIGEELQSSDPSDWYYKYYEELNDNVAGGGRKRKKSTLYNSTAKKQKTIKPKIFFNKSTNNIKKINELLITDNSIRNGRRLPRTIKFTISDYDKNYYKEIDNPLNRHEIPFSIDEE